MESIYETLCEYKGILTGIICVLFIIDVINIYCRYRFQFIPQEERLEDYKAFDFEAAQKENKSNITIDIFVRVFIVSFILLTFHNPMADIIAFVAGLLYCVFVLYGTFKTLNQLLNRIRHRIK
jgi:hypothetical protein